MKWSELSMTERNEVIKMAVAQGIKDIPSIKNLYEESVNGSRRFEDGGDTNPAMTGMMKSKLATAAHFGNPTARRMTNYDTRSYTWPNEYEYDRGIGEPKRGNVYVGSYGNLVTPQIQDNGRNLEFVDDVWSPKNDQRSYMQSLKFNNEKDARYFGEHYKEIAPMMHLYAEGGKIHIKPENRGKFTALKERTGHSATWFKEHGTPAQKKMATFALNASKWKHGDGGDLYGGELPEVTVTGYAPLRLTTYYPVTSKYPYTGHSELDIPIDRQTWYNYIGEEPSSDRVSPYITIDKKSSAEDYNLVTNNCADATLNFLNNAFGTSEKPWLFTTPGDVRDYALKELNGKLIENNDGSDTVLIPRNAKTAGKLSTTALNMFDKDLRGTAHILYKGPFRKRKHGLGGNLFEGGGLKVLMKSM